MTEADFGKEPEIQQTIQYLREEKETRLAMSSTTNGIQPEYTDLVSVLRCTIFTSAFKIEFLPASHALPHGSNVFVEDHVVAIPKRTLKNAFISAREVFFNNCADSDGKILESEQAICDASAILLLLAPEHLTAANARKRVILAWEKTSKEISRGRIDMDLWMLDSMFTSPLNKHTKSPTLWAHRRWLVQRLPPLELPRQDREISLVALVAADMHARNYYAWGYLRWWISTNPDLFDTFELYSTHTSSLSEPIPIGLPSLANSILKWCMKHPSDTSGWSFLAWLLTRSDNTASKILKLRGPFTAICESLMKWSRSLKLRNESLWIFLRTIMASDDMPEELRQAFICDCTAIAESDSEMAQSRVVAQSTLRWLRRQRV